MAQAQAKEALDEYNAAKKASEDARAAYYNGVDEYNAAVEAKKDNLPPRPSGFTDPGTAKAKAKAAQDKLDEARRQRNEAADTARSAVAAARDAAPPKPRTAKGYHGHLTPERELDIISNPDGIYISKGGAERLIFHQGEDIVIMESKGAGRGNIITSYGPSGPKNDSGAEAWGGSPDDPGPPVTREQIVEERIPNTKGGYLPPAEQLR